FACSGPTYRNHGPETDLLYSIPFVTAYLRALRRMALALLFSSGRISSMSSSTSNWLLRSAKLVDARLFSYPEAGYQSFIFCLVVGSVEPEP
ncbi:hypothetical protein Tco_1172278, partial [Tanacetum coccineum]